MAVHAQRLPVLVLHFHKRITGVSASAASVLRQQLCRDDLDVVICGDPLPELPAPLSRLDVIRWIKQQTHTTIIHARRNSEMRFGLFLRDILRLDVKIIFTSAAKRKHSFVPRWLIDRMDGVIATSDEAAVLVPHVLATIPHGVDTDYFAPRPAETWPDLGFGGQFGVATLGRVRAEKGTDRYVEALCDLLPSYPEWHGVIIGLEKASDRAFGAALREKLSQAGIEDRVHFLGALPQKDVARILPALSLYVAPPRYEGFGLTVLEAMAAGVPVVATDTGAFAEILSGGVGGTLVENKDGPHIADAMRVFMDNPDSARDLGAKARHRVVEHFSSKRESDAIKDCYDRLLTL